MIPPADPATENRIGELERQVKELRLRVAALERALDVRTEHPADRTVVSQKVTYDWQS